MSPIRKSIAMLTACIGLIVLVGCNQPVDKFAGFASEQLSERLDIVNEKLDMQASAMLDGEKRDGELMDAIRNLASTVDELKAARNEDLQRLREVASKAKVRLTADTPQEAPKTLNPNDAPAAKLTLDSLDEAAEQIENLMRRVDELEKRSKAFEASQPKATYQSVSSSSSYGSTGTSFSGGSNGTNAAATVVYQQPPTVYYESVSSPVTYQSSSTTTYSAPASSSYTCVDQYGNPVPCNQQVQYEAPRRGLFGRILNR